MQDLQESRAGSIEVHAGPVRVTCRTYRSHMQDLLESHAGSIGVTCRICRSHMQDVFPIDIVNIKSTIVLSIFPYLSFKVAINVGPI